MLHLGKLWNWSQKNPQLFNLTRSKAVAWQRWETKMLSWLEDNDCATIQSCGLTSYMQLQQANSFILKIFEGSALLPNSTDTKQETLILYSQLATVTYSNTSKKALSNFFWKIYKGAWVSCTNCTRDGTTWVTQGTTSWWCLALNKHKLMIDNIISDIQQEISFTTHHNKNITEEEKLPKIR